MVFVVEKNEKSSHISRAQLCPNFQLYLPRCGFFTTYTGRFGFLPEGGVSAFNTPYTEVEKLGKNDYLSRNNVAGMRKKEVKPTLLYCVPDELLSKMVDEYIDYVMNPYHEWRQTEEWSGRAFLNGFSMGNVPAPPLEEVVPERQPLKQRGVFDSRKPKYQLSHKRLMDKVSLLSSAFFPSLR